MSSISFAAVFALSACSSPVSEAELIARAEEAIASGDLNAAELDVKTALQQNPENAVARSLYGEIYLSQVNPGAAIAEFERSLKSSESSETRLALAKALVQAGQSAELLSDFDAGLYVSLASVPEFNAVLARAYLGQQQLSEARRALMGAKVEGNDYVDVTKAAFAVQLDDNPAEAAAILDGILDRNASNADANSFRAYLAALSDDYEAAVQYLQAAIDANAYRLPDRIQLVKAQIRIGDSSAASKGLTQLDKLIPEYPEVNFLQGQLLFDQGNYQGAIEEFSQALTVNPNHMGSLLLAANANLREGNLATAERQLTQFVSRNPDNATATLQLGSLYMQKGEPKKAEDIAKGVLQNNADSVPAMAVLATALATQGRNSESVDVYARIAALQPDSVEAKVALGSQQFVAGDTESGLQQLQEAAEQDPESTVAKERLIDALLSLGETGKALSEAQSYRASFTDDPRSALYLGRVLLQVRDVDGARLAFNEALKLEPGNVSASGGLAALAVLDDDLDGARDVFKTALSVNEGDLGTSMNLAVILEQLGDVEQMEGVLGQAIDTNPDAVEPRVALARKALVDEDPSRVVELLSELANQGSRDSRVFGLLANAHLAAGEPESAAPHARRLLELASTEPEVLEIVARVELANGHPDKAQRHLESALVSLPDDVALRKQLIDALVRQEKFSRALDEIASLPTDVQDDPAVLNVRGRLMGYSGDFRQAAVYLGRAFELYPSGVTLTSFASAKWAMGLQGEAIAQLSEWLEDQPDDMLVRNQLASRYLELGENDAALTQYKLLVDQDPDSVVVLNNLAWLMRSEDTATALEYIARADKLAPQSPQIKDTYAMVELENGNMDRALALNAKALEAAQGSPDIRYNRAQILVRAGQKDKAADLLRELVAGPAFASQADAKALLDTL
ncbi:PEP-CTERM system TPR-repeat protein PrsT [Congregibacter brevis]|uniref:PEP-CTERM system TPR-repeat protein PrsT n=1 Tax=Congregibacter brevis TaxID=3081201 RepID=A0ABZ0IFH2_9GAMM|nr:PEP-CTERM system TPR-repeat protein PrsT [Congregibacter sp. IMCC45268]